MSDTYVSRRSTYTSTNNYNRDIVDLQPLVIFQFLDESFLPVKYHPCPPKLNDGTALVTLSNNFLQPTLKYLRYIRIFN